MILVQVLGMSNATETTRLCEACRALAANSRGGYGSFSAFRECSLSCFFENNSLVLQSLPDEGLQWRQAEGMNSFFDSVLFYFFYVVSLENVDE